MPQFDRATMRFMVTVALLYCVLIASGFGFFWRCLYFCEGRRIHLSMRRIRADGDRAATRRGGCA